MQLIDPAFHIDEIQRSLRPARGGISVAVRFPVPITAPVGVESRMGIRSMLGFDPVRGREDERRAVCYRHCASYGAPHRIDHSLRTAHDRLFKPAPTLILSAGMIRFYSDR